MWVPDYASLEENYIVIPFKKVSLFFQYCLGPVSSPAMLPSFLPAMLFVSFHQTKDLDVLRAQILICMNVVLNT